MVSDHRSWEKSYIYTNKIGRCLANAPVPCLLIILSGKHDSFDFDDKWWENRSQMESDTGGALSQREYKLAKIWCTEIPVTNFMWNMSQWSLRARDDQRQVVFFSPCRNYKAQFPKRVFLWLQLAGKGLGSSFQRPLVNHWTIKIRLFCVGERLLHPSVLRRTLPGTDCV